MLGHELRNPLAAISSAVQLMEMRGLDDPMLKRARDAAARQSEHMARLLDDLLDVARVTRGRITLKKEEIELAPVVQSAVEATHPLIESRAQTLSPEVAEAPLKVKGDAVRLAQVVSNLLENAAKYTPPGGHIWLELRRSDGRGRVGEPESGRAGEGAAPIPPLAHSPTLPFAEIRVRDDGRGIPPDLLTHVFDLFVQGERTLGRVEGGLGIGLTMVRDLVEMHGGTVEAHSAGPGKGSEFVVRLPLLERSEVQGSAAQDPHPEPRTLSPAKQVLLVEDNADAAEILVMTLEQEGYEVAVAHDGPAALAMAGSYRPDVVLLDLGMPGMDGYEVAERLRKLPGLADAPLVAVTGYGQDEDRDRTARAGFAHHLVKPIDPEALRRVLEEVPSPGRR